MKKIMKVFSLISFTACILLFNNLALAQTDTIYQVPRTINGQPDLQGVWANNTITPVERHDVFGDKKFLTDDDLVFLNQRVAELANQPGDALFCNNILITYRQCIASIKTHKNLYRTIYQTDIIINRYSN